MKKTIILSAAVVAFAFSACNSTNPAEQTTESTEQNFKLDTTMLKSGESFYQCSMDPDVVSDKAGACPKCGMDLEKKEKK
jgi:hypothetical protein